MRPATAADIPPLPELATRASDLERKSMMSALLKRSENMVLRRHHGEDGAQRARRRASRRTRSGLPVVPVLCVATGKVADRHLPDTRLKKELS
jgi:hypothetical protein